MSLKFAALMVYVATGNVRFLLTLNQSSKQLSKHFIKTFVLLLCPYYCRADCRHISIPYCKSGKQQCGGSPDNIMCTQCEDPYYSGGYGNGCQGNALHIQLNFVMSKWSGPRKILRHRNGST